MVSEGIDAIPIAFNVLGEAKVERIRALADKVRLSVVADNGIVVRGLSKFFEDTENPLSVSVECDTGCGRCGVARPKQAADLAKLISSLPCLTFGGLMTYPKADHDPQEVQEWLAR